MDQMGGPLIRILWLLQDNGAHLLKIVPMSGLLRQSLRALGVQGTQNILQDQILVMKLKGADLMNQLKDDLENAVIDHPLLRKIGNDIIQKYIQMIWQDLIAIVN